ncbi:uncharacterized protein LOC125203424 [Salvia hispanica]|uniref:uncharacterized protein LOC125203424 n=1 Tax=Salvia hispanica TaxID=49212 RepID=UPI002009CD47|nr:uncharacterized protein LOC125203424 [Salvia hispanica]XP_047957718.1 uncharacterized protein LOC125203424 [Salvia hispanica]
MKDYLSKIKSYCDFLGSAGYRILEEDHILHILSGVGSEYDSIMVTISSSADRWTVGDVASLLLSFESRLKSVKSNSINIDGSQPSANLVQPTPQRSRDTSSRVNYSHGRNDGNCGGFRGRGGRGGRFGNRLICQLCQKPGHSADCCWSRFDQNIGQPLTNLSVITLLWRSTSSLLPTLLKVVVYSPLLFNRSATLMHPHHRLGILTPVPHTMSPTT